MNRNVAASFALAAGLAALGLTSTRVHADSSQFSPERFDDLDKWGYFTPEFKSAIHDFVESKEALEKANAENKEFALELPGLQQQAQAAQAKTVALRQELAKYEHPDETDFAALQSQMNDPNARLTDQIEMAQAYVWAYPASPHESVAQQFLQQVQKKQADQIQADKDAEATREAAHAKLVQRALAHDLSVSEWRDFLRDMSQDDLVKLLGRPSSASGDFWTYSGPWIVDPATQQKVGIQINFDAGRVLSVDEIPPPP